MTRLGPRDRLLFLGLSGLFVACWLLHVSVLLKGGIGWIPVQVAAPSGPEGHPSVRALWSTPEATDSGLRIGDLLLAAGEADLRGAGPIGFVARLYGQSHGRLEVPVRFERDGRAAETILRLVPVPYPLRTAIVAAAFAAIGAIAFWRARGSRPARLFFLAVVSYALHWCYFWGGSLTQTHAALFVFLAATSLASPFTLRTILVFPEEVARSGWWAALWPWLFASAGLFVSTWAFGFPLPPALGLPLGVGASVAMIALALVALANSYRRAGPRGRRQLRWVLFGFYLGLAPPGLAGVLTLAAPRLWWLYELSLIAVIAIPICLLIALIRDNLFDIDRLITGAASYTILSILLLAGLFGLVPRVTSALQGVADPGVTQTALSLGLAAVVLSGQRSVEQRVQRLLFVEREALERGAQALRELLGTCATPGQLLTALGQRMEALLRPDSLVIYGRTGSAFAPVFASGRAVPPAFDAEGPLIARLASQRETVEATRLLGLRAGEALSRAERGALQALGAEVLLPVAPRHGLAAFVCLGEKRSGDVYTSTDLALLASLADRASIELERFDEAEIYRQERELHQRLARYVPGAVVEHLQTGALEAGEREVTVLFVDIRGYTSLSEGRGADAIFSLVNRYTGEVSRIVRDHGGAVVEFNGDGMMAVFGAPRPLPDKERSAVRAARAIVAAIQELPVDHDADRDARLEVGVGIATGPAFVGSVRAADRMIWTALGNTTNLAARLQTLSRDMDAAVVVDAFTREAASGDAGDFISFPGQQVRGRTGPLDLYALPRSPDQAA